MRFTTKIKKIFSPSAKGRESGHYWVLWSGRLGSPDVWRIGGYHSETGSWKVIGDDRLYYDKDFMEINETRIQIYHSTSWWVVLWIIIGIILNISIAFFYYINYTT